MESQNENPMRDRALELAIRSAMSAETKEDVVARAEAYLLFMQCLSDRSQAPHHI